MSDPGRPTRGRVPYGRWRRWVRSLRRRSVLVRAAEGGGDPNDRVYLAYGVVLLGLVYGPILWSAVAQAGTALSGTGLSGWAPLVVGVASLATLAAARAGGPLWVSPPEATFALGGQFRPREVLWRRAAALVVGTAVVGAFVVTALARGTGAAPLHVLAGGACGALLAQLPLTVGVAAQAPRWRTAARATTGLLLGLGVVAALVTARLPAGLGSVTGTVAGSLTGLLVGAAVVGAGCVVLVVRVLPERLDVDVAAAGHRRALAAGRGLAGGDSAAVADVLGPERFSGRGASFLPGLLRRAPVVARDLVGLRRRAGALWGAVAAGVAGAVLVLLGSGGVAVGGPVVAVTGAALLYGASATWAVGLRAFAAQHAPGALLPGGVGRVTAAHTVVPGVVGVGGAVVAWGVSWPVAAVAGSGGPAPVGAVLVLACVLVVVLACRVWVAGATAASPALFTPMMTPNGDASMLVLGAWYLRGWLVVTGVAWLSQRVGAEGVVPLGVAVVALAVWLVRSAVVRLARA